MNDILDTVLTHIESVDPLHAKKLRLDLQQADEKFHKRARVFLEKFVNFLTGMNKDLDYGIECYLKTIADFRYEHMRFFQSGEYSSKSFEEVNQRVYKNDEVMEYYIIGQLLSRFLMTHHYQTFAFFVKHLPLYKKSVHRYLEIGGGHGLFISEALCSFNHTTHFDLLDISPRAIEISKQFIDDQNVNYIQADILDYIPPARYDFITMGEVLEHVENPAALLLKLKDFLHDDGVIYITVPANAAAIDHIYLFKNAQEIREMFKEAGLTILDETSSYAEKISSEKAEALRIPLMYGAFLAKSK